MVNLKKRERPRVSVSTSGIAVTIYYPTEQIQTGEMQIDITQYPFSDAWKRFSDEVENTLSNPTVRSSLGFGLDESARKSKMGKAVLSEGAIDELKTEALFPIMDAVREKFANGFDKFIDDNRDNKEFPYTFIETINQYYSQLTEVLENVEMYLDSLATQWSMNHPEYAGSTKKSFNDMIKSQHARNYQDPKQMKKSVIDDMPEELNIGGYSFKKTRDRHTGYTSYYNYETDLSLFPPGNYDGMGYIDHWNADNINGEIVVESSGQDMDDQFKNGVIEYLNDEYGDFKDEWSNRKSVRKSRR